MRREDGPLVDRLPNGNWTYERRDDVVILTRRWDSSSIGCFSFLLLFVLAVTMPTAFGWISSPDVKPRDFLILGLSLSAIVGYLLLLAIFNRMHIEVSPRTGVTIRHGPLPTLNFARNMRTRDIAQIYVQRTQTERKGDIIYFYELRVQRPKGGTESLLSAGLSDREALFLERTLERHLGIEDRAVPGAFKPEGSA